VMVNYDSVTLLEPFNLIADRINFASHFMA
jgi:hypothetical protein